MDGPRSPAALERSVAARSAPAVLNRTPPAHPRYAPFLLENPPFDVCLFISNGLTGEDGSQSGEVSLNHPEFEGTQ